jgi:hypothetical protein
MVTRGSVEQLPVVRRGSSWIVPAYLDERLPRIDLRELPSSRFRIVRTAYWLRDDERARYGGQEYELVREPENKHDENAVAVYGRGRKVGHLSAAKAAALASDLDRLGPASFIVSGDTVSEASMKMWVDIPRVPGSARSSKASSLPLVGVPRA